MTRDDMFDEATCALDKMISLTTIVVDFFDFPELTREQLSDIQSRSKEICDIIFSVRDYITRLQEIIETLSKEDKPQKKEMSTEYFHKRYNAMQDLEKAKGLLNIVEVEYNLNSRELEDEEVEKIKAGCGHIATLLSAADDYIENVLKLLRGENNEGE